MGKVFQIIKKIQQVVGGSINFMAPQKPGIAVSTRNTGTAAHPVASAGVAVQQAPLTLMARQRPAVAVETSATGSASANQTAGIEVRSRLALTPGPLQKPGVEVVHVKIDLTHRSGVQSQSVSGDAWTNPNNVLGDHDGAVASISGAALSAKDSVFTLPFVDFVNKTDLTITQVRLHYYCSQTGTLLNNAATRLRYDFGGTDTELEILTGDVSSLVVPRTFDITAAIGGSWAQLNALRGIISFVSAIAETYTFNLDAIELEIIATKTEAA